MTSEGWWKRKEHHHTGGRSHSIPSHTTEHKHIHNPAQKDSEHPGLSLNVAPGPWAGVWMGHR